MENIFSEIRTRYDHYKYQNFLRMRKHYCYAPYSLEVYELFLGEVARAADKRIIPFLNDRGNGKGKFNIYVRHDIDTKKCAENMDLVVEIDKKLNIPAGIYMRADGIEYSLQNFKGILKDYRSRGLEIGLHTLCYQEDDYIREFRDETERFEEEAGFQPKSFSVHGLGDIRTDIREKFMLEISQRYSEFGYATGDIPQLRSYRHVIHDCHLDEEKRRFIYDDFQKFPKCFSKGLNYLILTHPCYWRV